MSLYVGPPSPPESIMFDLNYTTATDVEIEVNISWLSLEPRTNEDLSVVYEITITDELTAGMTNYTSTATSFTARLKFEKTYLISLSVSRCNGTLRSGPIIKNITVHMNAIYKEFTSKEGLFTAKSKQKIMC